MKRNGARPRGAFQKDGGATAPGARVDCDAIHPAGEKARGLKRGGIFDLAGARLPTEIAHHAEREGRAAALASFSHHFGGKPRRAVIDREGVVPESEAPQLQGGRFCGVGAQDVRAGAKLRLMRLAHEARAR